MRRVLWVALAAIACGKSTAPARDAGVDRVPHDSAATTSDATTALAVDFAVEDCPSLDMATLSCTGNVPFSVRFVPLATTTVTQYLWDFGDGSGLDVEITPTHVYATPGVYSVRVIATGTSSVVVIKTHANFVVAQANGIGDACDSDAQCESGMFCLCSSLAPCATGPTHGLCAAYCQAGVCNDTQACAGLLTATPPSGAAAAWQASLCLAPCETDSDCPTGLGCRTLPPDSTGSGWVHGCFVDVPGDVGSSCMDSSGRLRGDLCATGMCADLGAKGLCTMNCGVASCPAGSDCAILGDGRKLCLRPCVDGFSCTNDPLLTCVVPGTGDLGYQLLGDTGSGATSSYCAPMPCASDSSCLPTGTCVIANGGGHCVRR